MSDPYRILELDPSASDDAVRAAYKRLLVKYSTDEYAESPLRDIADGKLAELDAAFDQIMSERRLGDAPRAEQRNSGGYTDYSAAGSSSSGAYDGWSADAREHLRRGNISSAEQRLLAVDPAERGAEWNYLMGAVCSAKGWLDDAGNYYANAASMDPNNTEYASAQDQLNRRRATGTGGWQPNTTSGTGCFGSRDCDSLCQLLCCMSLCNSCCCNN